MKLNLVTDVDESFIGHTMVQYTSDGCILFLHRNLLKRDETDGCKEIWEMIKKSGTESVMKSCIIYRDFKEQKM